LHGEKEIAVFSKTLAHIARKKLHYYVLDSARSKIMLWSMMRIRVAIKIWCIVLIWGTCSSSVSGDGRDRNSFSGKFPSTLALLQSCQKGDS